MRATLAVVIPLPRQDTQTGPDDVAAAMLAAGATPDALSGFPALRVFMPALRAALRRAR